MKIERIGEDSYELGESPIWDPVDGALYFVDSLAHAVDPRNGGIRRWDVALRAGGGAVLAMDDGYHAFDFETGVATPIVEPEAGRDDLCFNDGKVDRQGRFVVGSMHTGASEPLGALYRLDADLGCSSVDGDYICSNGPCWSPDGATLYVTDTYAEAIFAYDYDTATGAVDNRRTFHSIKGSDGYPDGGTVDAEGHVWSVQFGAGKIRRIAPDGTVERVIELPVQSVASLTFGGADHDVLYVTSIGGEDQGERDSSPGAGGLFAVNGLGVQGLAEPRFKG
ncbi:MAG: SMP-30/gluconolactonase/LRE family protein [Alphaproteobacteria bacterium]